MTEQVEKPVSDVEQEKPKRSRKKAATDEVVAPQSNDANESVKDAESDAQTQPESTGDGEKDHGVADVQTQPESTGDSEKSHGVADVQAQPESTGDGEKDHGVADAQTQPESTGDSEKGPESAADQQKPTDISNFFKLPVFEQSTDTEQTDNAEEVKPALAANQLRILNKGPASFCRISGKKLPTNMPSLINFASTAQKQRALSNFKQLNNLAGYERYIVEGS